MSGTIRIRREHSPWINRFRRFRILIDDVEVTRIANRETVELTVPAGDFSIAAYIDWVGSPTIQSSVGEGEVMSFTVRNGDSLALVGNHYLSLKPEID